VIPESTAPPLLLPLPLLEPLLPPLLELLPDDDPDESKLVVPLSNPGPFPPPGGPLLCEHAANHAEATSTAAHPLLFVIPRGYPIAVGLCS
jgi:hypothetical protein